MKKYIVGFVAGIVMAMSATAFADDIQSLIGKTVQAQYTVQIGDQTLSTIVVEGKNYAPVRSIGEAAGYEVVTDGKNVVLKEGTKLDTTALKEKQKADKILGLQKGIANIKITIEQLKNLLQTENEKYKNATTDGVKNAAQSSIDDLELRLQRENESLDKAEAQLAELQQ